MFSIGHTSGSFNTRVEPLLAAAWICLALAILFQTVQAERLPVRTYTIADGQLRDSVSRIVQDSRGFLWFCTADGVSRFDGYGFTNFTTDDGLPERHVNDVLELAPNMIFLATDGGLARLNPTGARHSTENPLFSVFLPDDSTAKAFKVLLKEPDGSLLAGTDAGLYRVTIDKDVVDFNRISLGPSPDNDRVVVTTLFRDSAGTLWIGTGNHIARIRAAPGSQPENFGVESGVPGAGVSDIAEDANGKIWVAMRDFGGLLLLARDAPRGGPIVTRLFREKDGLPSDWISDVLVGRDGRIQLATPGGLCEWDGSEGSVCRRTYRSRHGLCDAVINLHEDRDGNLWVTSPCGTKRIARYGFTSFDTTDGLGFQFPDALFENRSGDLFAVSRDSTKRSVSRFDGEKFELVNLLDPSGGAAKGYGWGWKQTAFEDRVGDWWVAGYALLRFRKPQSFAALSRVVPERMEMKSRSREPFRIYEDSRGDVWVGTFGLKYELLRWERATGAWRDYTSEAGLSRVSLVSGFLEDRSGNLWIATGIDNGREALLIRYRDGNFRSFTEKDGVPPGWMRDAYLDSSGRIWFANTSVGLARLVDPDAETGLEFVTYGRSEGMASDGIYCVVEDDFGRIYAGSGRGIDRIDLATGRIENFTTSDGLPNNQVEIALRDRRGDLWFSTMTGLARLKTGPPLRDRVPPKALISGVRTPHGSLPISIQGESAVPDVRLAAHAGAVSVDFIGLGAALGEKLRYEYRLGGGSWTPTSERTINIADLTAGEFMLEVRAITGDGLMSEPATVAFDIAAPVWQRWWFITILGCVIAVIIYLLYKNRVARLVQFERMRTRIATDLHDDIGANLTRISLLSEVAKQKAVNGNTELLTSIAEISRESVASMNDIVWAVSPDHDRLVDLVRRMRSHAEEVFTLRDIDLEFSAPEADGDLHLGVGVRRDLLLIFKEAVNNAARHSDCTSVKIELALSSSLLTLSIDDNGKGFALAAHDGQGLRSMKRRAAALGGKLEIKSVIDVGTAIRFEIPLRQASVV